MLVMGCTWFDFPSINLFIFIFNRVKIFVHVYLYVGGVGDTCRAYKLAGSVLSFYHESPGMFPGLTANSFTC